uniref:Putative secreted protein n=1 Tax=Anopheles darlingi TaxID=43151 RepID=A0A2M4DPT7_ANODA
MRALSLSLSLCSCPLVMRPLRVTAKQQEITLRITSLPCRSAAQSDGLFLGWKEGSSRTGHSRRRRRRRFRGHSGDRVTKQFVLTPNRVE